MQGNIYIVGGGAVGAPLAAFLTKAGRQVVLLRSGGAGSVRRHETVMVRGEAETLSIAVEEQAFAESGTPDGWVVVAAKAHANAEIAGELARRSFAGPIVLLQNGIGVENPFVEAGFRQMLRGVLYVTSERNADRDFTLRAPRPSPLGIISGDVALLDRALGVLSVPEMPFVGDADIGRCVWRKTIINAVFNSICTLTDRNNRLFVESPAAMALAERVVSECVCLAANHGVILEREQLLEDIRMISSNSSQLISTLQDVRAGRPTEMEFMNLGLARMAKDEGAPVDLTLTSGLGELVMIKAGLASRPSVC
jgi:2-dehydropantoate 2-reductase